LRSIWVRPQKTAWEVIQTEDQTIINLFWERSEDALVALERKYGRLLHRTAYSVLENRQDSEETVADSYMKLWDAIPPARPESLCAYALRIVRNTALNRLQHRQRQKRDARQDVLLSELSECLSASDSPAAQLEAEETLELINRWLHSLKKTDRLLFMRRYFTLQSIEHIAADFGMTPNAVSIRLCRLRSALRQELRKEDICV